MRTRTITAATALLIITLAGCGKSEEQKQSECVKAIDSTSTVTSRPDACKDIATKDYKLFLMAYAVRQSGIPGTTP